MDGQECAEEELPKCGEDQRKGTEGSGEVASFAPAQFAFGYFASTTDHHSIFKRTEKSLMILLHLHQKCSILLAANTKGVRNDWSRGSEGSIFGDGCAVVPRC